MTTGLPAVPDRLLYHFTHIDNLSSTLACGELHADSRVGAQLATELGDRDIKADRRRRPVDCPPGGVVADHVPFYFAPRSPMMYRIACDHRDAVAGRFPDGEDSFVYLVATIGMATACPR